MIDLGRISVTLDQKSINSIAEATIISINGEDFIRKKVAVELVSKFADEKVAPMEKELASLKEENAKLRNKTINEAIAAILSSDHTKSLAIMGAVNDIIKKVESLKSAVEDNK